MFNCVGNSVATTCSAGYNLVSNVCTTCVSSTAACTSACIALGYYSGSGTASCTACPVNTLLCTSGTVATSCSAGYFLSAAGVCTICSGTAGVASTGNTCTSNGYYLAIATPTPTVYTACGTGSGTLTCNSIIALTCSVGYYLGLNSGVLSGPYCLTCGSNILSCATGGVPTSALGCSSGFYYVSAS
jgi:hypothetical protein